MAETMKAVRFAEYGPPEVLRVEQVPRPLVEPGQLVVEVRAAGVHPIDTKLRSGMLREWMPVELPFTPGRDFAGVVEDVGEDVEGYEPGVAVFGRAGGTYAEHVEASADETAPIPDGVGFEQAAALPVGAGTAWAAVIDAAQVDDGQRVLVHGGGGGVGHYAVQLARWKGAEVTATASAANSEFVRALGADRMIDYQAHRFEDAARDMDAVIDTVGGDVLERSFGVLRTGGILVTIAGQPSEQAAAEHGVRAVSVRGVVTGSRLAEIAGMVADGTLRVEVGKVFPLEQAAAAHALSETGHGRGRILLRVSAGD
jgi:NADPH:quinone reductase-like Zn-dependent oxidoreductase